MTVTRSLVDIVEYSRERAEFKQITTSCAAARSLSSLTSRGSHIDAGIPYTNLCCRSMNQGAINFSFVIVGPSGSIALEPAQAGTRWAPQTFARRPRIS